MASKLTDITASYHSFTPDQVLTHNQLNEVLNYFDDQDRLSRIALSGVGIVCGFSPTLNSQGILLTQGAGVTTDGDMVLLQNTGSVSPLKNINLTNVQYTNYRTFTDDKAIYPQFRRNGSQIPIWEIIPSTEVTNVAVELPIPGFPNIANMVVLLYIESFEDEENLCQGLSCDNQGLDQVQRLRALIVSESDALYILQNDSLFTKHELMSTYMQMKDLSVQRIIVNPVNAATSVDLKNSFRLAPHAQTIADLIAGLNLMSAKLGPYYSSNPIPSILNGINVKLASSITVETSFYQYRYDLLKDVVDSYNEAKELFIHIATECCPSITAFPKHLMIGKLVPTESDLLIGTYRHSFYKSPILIDDSRDALQFMSILQRMDEQLKAYPLYPETPNTGLFRPVIKITPSRYRSVLGKKAIPFYYNLDTPLLKVWDQGKAQMGKYRKNLSYNTGPLDPSPSIQTPLLYNLEPYNFLRIEGHQGHDFKEALSSIDSIKHTNGLAFDVKALSIDLDTNIVIGTDNYETEFGDLSVLLNAWVKEQECNLASVTSLVSAYSLQVPGKNIKEALFTPRQQSVGTTLQLGEQGGLKLNEAVAPVTNNLGTINLDAVQDLNEVKAQNQQAFNTNNVVLDNLTLDPNTLGYSVFQSIKNNVLGSANDIMIEANNNAIDYVNTHGILWDPYHYSAIVNNSVEVLSYAHILSNSIPLSIAGITDQVITNYNTNINKLCLVLKRVQTNRANTTTLSDTNQRLLQSLDQQLSSICCASEQLKTLLTEIDKRKDAILEQLTLKKFVEQNPGLEHLGGVEPGGTFILVYLKKGVAVPGVQTTANGTVIADFSMPYMCCSDSSPVNFIVPKADVQLRLPKNIFCLGQDTSPMIFQVEPADGIIKADRTIPGVIISGNQLTIDTALFPTASLNQIINFTVNDQLTNCQLTVVQPINATFTVPNPATSSDITFTPIGNFPSGTLFRWEFGDGVGTSTLQSPTYHYTLPVNSTNTVTVKLTVTPGNGACPTVVTKNMTFQQVQVTMDSTDYCSNDFTPHPITVTPTGASVTLTGQGVNNAARTFTPGFVLPGSVTIFVNGAEGPTVDVNPPPTVTADGFVDEQVNLFGHADNAQGTYWSFEQADGVKIHETVNKSELHLPFIEFNDGAGLQPGSTFLTHFHGTNQCGEQVKTITLSVPANTESCTVNAAGNIQDKMAAITKFINDNDPETFGKLTQSQQNLFYQAREINAAIASDLSKFMNGDHNDYLSGNLGTLFVRIHDEIIKVGNPQAMEVTVMTKLYSEMMQIYLGTIQCQSEDLLIKEDQAAMFDLFTSHIDPSSDNSFSNSDIVLDQDGALAPSILNTRDFRVEDSYSWNRLNDLWNFFPNLGGAAALKSSGPDDKTTPPTAAVAPATVAESVAPAATPSTTPAAAKKVAPRTTKAPKKKK